VKVNRTAVAWVLLWAVLLVVLIIGLLGFDTGSTVFGGALGAFCGATVVVIFTVRERAAQRRRAPAGSVAARYGRR
jgi:membrane associated rhomboid family serine protease